MNINGHKSGATGQVYILLAKLFSFPDVSLQSMLNDAMLEILQDTVTALPFKIKTGKIPALRH